MKRLLQRLPIVMLLPAMLCSCIDSGYDLNDLDDSGGLSPALILPIGTLKMDIMSLITEAGIANDLIEINDNTISVVYRGSMSIEPALPIPGFSNEDVIYSIPEGIELAFAEGEKSIDIDVFEAIASSGSILYPANPQIRLQIKNYIGANVDIDVNKISTYDSEGRQTNATFANGDTSVKIQVEGAATPYEYAAHSETFDKINGKLNELFSIAPSRLSCDFRVNKIVPTGDRQHFIVNGRYIDFDYEIKLPMTFSAGTQLVSSDTLDFFDISNLDELALWIDYENGISATIGLDILFLDEYKQVIPDIDRHFRIKAAETAAFSNASLGSLSLMFDSSEFDAAKKARYVVLTTGLKVDSGSNEVSIRSTDYINLKLSAYAKVNI